MKKQTLLCIISFVIYAEAYSQNVGIGTNTPAFKLDVQGRMRVKAGTLNNVNTSGGIWMDDYRNGTNQFFFGMKDSIRAGFYGSGIGWDLLFNSESGMFGPKFSINGTINIHDGTSDNSSGAISGNTNDLYIAAKKSTTNPRGNLVLQWADPRNPTLTAGNVGIGIDSPSYKLSLDGSAALYNGSSFIGLLSRDGNDFLINARTGNTFLGSNPENLILQYSSGLGATTGRVGIGTNAPMGRLHVAGSTGELMRLGTSATGIQFTNDFIQFFNGSAGKFFMQLAGNNLTLSHSSGNNSGVLILNGNSVTIGQVTPANGYKLSIGGKAICEELKVQLQGNWPDYVFENEYKLKSFDELRQFIRVNNHLPNIPAASEVEKNGMEVGEMQRKMMEKIEELTLYILQLEEQLKEVKERLGKKQ